jgi:hypothetical protein
MKIGKSLDRIENALGGIFTTDLSILPLSPMM